MAELTRTKQMRKKKRGKGRIQRIVIWSLITIALVVFGFAIYTYAKVDRFLDDIVDDDGDLAQIGFDPVERKYTKEPFAMVLLGLDSREQTGSLNTDVMIVAVVEPETKQVTMLSLPRDTAIAIPGYSGYHKINSVYATGEVARRNAERKKEPITENGSSLLKKTLEGLLGIPIKHYVTIDFEGFVKVIDDLDGIEVDVERNLIYHDPTDGTAINLKKGLQTLNGKQALDYVRHRQDDRGTNYYSSDFDRNRRQQLVINKVVDKMKTFSGITKIYDIMETVGNHMKTDLSKEKIKGLALDFMSIGSENITTLETDAYWDSKILKTVIPIDKLEEIRLALWDKMGISEKEGRAKLLKENDLAVINLTKERQNSSNQQNQQHKANASVNNNKENDKNKVTSSNIDNQASDQNVEEQPIESDPTQVEIIEPSPNVEDVETGESIEIP